MTMHKVLNSRDDVYNISQEKEEAEKDSRNKIKKNQKRLNATANNINSNVK